MAVGAGTLAMARSLPIVVSLATSAERSGLRIELLHEFHQAKLTLLYGLVPL